MPVEKKLVKRMKGAAMISQTSVTQMLIGKKSQDMYRILSSIVYTFFIENDAELLPATFN
jgi:hypothetical protein